MVVVILITTSIGKNATSVYNEKKDNLLRYSNVSVELNKNDDKKEVVISNYNDSKAVVGLVFKISKFSNEYVLKINDEAYDLSKIARTEDDEYYYYNIGTFEVSTSEVIDYEVVQVGCDVYDDDIVYSFMAEVVDI